MSPGIGRIRPYGEIEPGIKPLVDSMNRTQVMRTLASCQGHINGKPPYVYFKASVAVAAALEKSLRELAAAERPILHTDWVVYGLFDAAYEQTFLLHAPEYHRRAHSMASIWLFGVNRKRLNADLLTLAAHIDQAMLPNIREVDKPCVGSNSN